jgi:hypothetical protein
MLQVRLKSGRIDDAIGEMGRQKAECETSLNPHDAEERLASFLKWTNAAESMLANHFTDSPLFDRLYTTRTQAINLTGKPDYIIHGFLNREYRQWQAAFETEIENLRDLSAFVAVSGRPVALDTSALMEGPFFTECCWAAGMAGSGTVHAGPYACFLSCTATRQ